MKKVLYILVGVWICIPGRSQSIADDLLAITEAFQKSGSYTVKVNISLYTATDQKPAQTLRFHFRKNENQQILVYDQVTMIANKKEQLMIDGANKRVVYAKQPEPLKIDWKQLSLDRLKPREQEKPKEELVSESNGTRHYRLSFSSGWFRQADIYVNSSRSRIVKIIYTYNSEKSQIYQKAVLDFEKMETGAVIGTGETDIKNYLVMTNGVPVKLVSQYADYHLIISQNPFE